MKKIIFTLTLASLLSLEGCKEEGRVDILNMHAPAPEPLSEVSVTPTHGGAILKYQIPKDENLLCVKAVYEIKPGRINETKGSIYVDSLVLKGFGTANTTQVRVYTVGRNGKESTPLLVDVTPLAPIVTEVFSSFKIKAAIGGVKIHYKNEAGENLTYVLIRQNPVTKQWETLKKFYSNLKEGQLLQRGMKSKETNVGVYVTDRWGNSSDTVTQILTPVYEKEIPKPFAHREIAGDNWIPGAPNFGIENLWDGRWDIDAQFIYATAKNIPLPQSFTIDLKHLVEITRVVEHQRPKYAYLDTSVKEFELFGTAVEMPNGDTNHPDWIKLGRFSSYQPSGMTGNPTPEDFQYGNVEGESFEFLDENGDPKPTPPIRYLRWRTYETWNGATEMGEVLIAELDIYGKIVGEEIDDEED
ncbi:DUF4959 domain-containing protein [Parabacteroides pacaensis]|uniref:DUF4959 domain-containing protein n=1 Tax=Parabacteroides pacaensis TaxID=2086575 RepID=UPI000D0FFDD8|nr:DUF4959 domain-containing protein [Parabacteroides pacaensis]